MGRREEIRQALQDRLQQALSTAALLGERSLAAAVNAIDRRFFTEKLIAADQTPYEVIHRNGLLSLRRYLPLEGEEITAGGERYDVQATRYRVPIVLVPPLAASTLIFDLLPNRSLVKFLLAFGYEVYLVDWGDPELDHSHLALKDYTTEMLPEALAQVRADSGKQELTLMGYCMGGLFCLVYAGWSQDPKIRNIVTIASPIDAHQIGIAGRLLPLMNAPARLVSKLTRFSILDIDPKYLRVPGWMSSAVFKLTNPLGTVQSYIDLLMNLWDREFVTEYQTTATWFNKMHDYPGGIVQDFVVRVGLDNQLAKGEVRMGERKALLDRINCSLLAIAGMSDRIVTTEAARKVMDIVASSDRDFILAPGGHAGVFGGSKAPGSTWLFAADWLSTRSD